MRGNPVMDMMRPSAEKGPLTCGFARFEIAPPALICLSHSYSRNPILRGAEADCPLLQSKRQCHIPVTFIVGFAVVVPAQKSTGPGYEPAPLDNNESHVGSALIVVDAGSRRIDRALTPDDAACEAGRSVLPSESRGSTPRKIAVGLRGVKTSGADLRQVAA
jgi:hypothetical protein